MIAVRRIVWIAAQIFEVLRQDKRAIELGRLQDGVLRNLLHRDHARIGVGCIGRTGEEINAVVRSPADRMFSTLGFS